MSFKEHDRKTYIADLARAFASRRISKREFLQEGWPRRRRLLGLQRRSSRQHPRLLWRHQPHRHGSHGAGRGRHPVAEGRGLPSSRAPRSATPRKPPLRRSFSTRSSRSSSGPPASTSKSRSSRSSRCSPRRRSTCRASRLLRPLLSRPVLDGDLPQDTVIRATTRTSRISRCRASTSTILQGLVKGLAVYEGKWVGIPFDIPIFITMYRQDLLDKHKLPFPKTVEEFTNAAKAIYRSREGQRHLRHRPPGQVGSLFAELRLDPDGVERRRLDLRRRQEVQGQ